MGKGHLEARKGNLREAAATVKDGFHGGIPELVGQDGGRDQARVGGAHHAGPCDHLPPVPPHPVEGPAGGLEVEAEGQVGGYPDLGGDGEIAQGPPQHHQAGGEELPVKGEVGG